MLGLTIEHPFDTIKTKMQAKGSGLFTFLYTTKEIHHTQGFVRGFYRGFLPNSVRATIKQFYRWPMAIAFPQLFHAIYPEKLQTKFISINKLSTGVLISALEAFIICPLERIKVVLMTTRAEQMTIKTFFHEERGNLTSSLLRGVRAQFYKQVVGWTSFLYLDHTYRYHIRSYLKLKDEEEMKGFALYFTSILIGYTTMVMGKNRFSDYIMSKINFDSNANRYDKNTIPKTRC